MRGSTAGFNTPTFVVDAPGGGGKRDAHSYEHYDRETGISVYQAPSVKPGQYLPVLRSDRPAPAGGRTRWADPGEHQTMIDEALESGAGRRTLAEAGGAERFNPSPRLPPPIVAREGRLSARS